MRNLLFPACLAGLFVSGAVALAADAVSLLQADKPELGWTFNDGREFPGAKGGAVRDSSVQRGGEDSLKITGDFTGGGNYVAADGRIPDIDIRELSFWVKGLDTDRMTLRVIEASGRCHQFVLAAKPSEDWQQIVLPLQQYFERQGRSDAVEGVLKYEAWGGGAQSFSNDGGWKGPGKAVSILLGRNKDGGVRTIWLSGVNVLPRGRVTTAFAEDFESSAQVPSSWRAEGAVTVDADAFQGARSLVLEKTDSSIRDKSAVTGPAFPVAPGMLEIEFATKSDLNSMDNSYNGTLSIDFLNAAGQSLGPVELGAWFRKNPWKKTATQLQVPDGAVTARFVASINKETPGKFRLDGLVARMASGKAVDDGLRRMMFTFDQLGHLLFPKDPRTAAVEVWSARELPESLRNASFTVRDYWGAEQSASIGATLSPAGKVAGKDFFKYEASVDLSGLPLREGRYYELHGTINRPGGEPFTNYTSFAILPEAAANQYKPEEVPFTSRTWDQRPKESPLLTHRLGIRICNVWGRMNPDASKLEAPQIDLVHELGMGILTSSPAQGIEARNENWRELLANDGALIRQGVRNFMAKYGEMKPLIVNLGNEPHSKGDDVKHDVEAYRIVYTEIKKIDPSIYVVGTSVGLEEEYFKAGFGQWLDAYDFHSYEDPEGVRTILTKGYPQMFKKYGNAKPVWSTEIGMNSQGMTRQAVASLVYRKFANFFAGGGANVSWFGLFYPDPDAKIHASFASAHNVFDCRYNKYSPKLDAIAYYNAVNSIAIKKFVMDKVYHGDAHMFLFRDRDGRSLVIAYKDSGRKDVFLPLPGANAVEMIRLDGSRDLLDAGGKGISLTVSEDPVLLLFENGPAGLPETLGNPAAGFTALPAVIFRDGENVVEATLDGAAADEVELVAPPLWKVEKSSAGNVVRFSLAVPADSQVREADLALIVRGAGTPPRGLLSARRPVAGMLSMEMLPIPAGQDKGPGIRLVVQNNSAKPQSLTWNVALNGEQSLAKGQFSEIVSTQANITGPSSGVLEVQGRATAEVRLPMSGVKPVTVYHAKATLRDDSGRVVSQERQVSGFVPVQRAAAPIKIDGLLDEAAWKTAAVEKLGEPAQFFGFKLSGREAPEWKGAEDLSTDIRYLWDDQYLYVSVKVKDDIAGAVAFEGADLWRQDGLQFLVDPMRRSKEKPGKYEYCIGLGTKGPQAWCTLSADPGAAPGDAKDIKTAIHRDKEGTGDVTYEIAIPWSRLAPFKPDAGNNLGFTMILNEDDGAGRDAFMTWFGNAHSKDIDTVGDLILMP